MKWLRKSLGREYSALHIEIGHWYSVVEFREELTKTKCRNPCWYFLSLISCICGVTRSDLRSWKPFSLAQIRLRTIVVWSVVWATKIEENANCCHQEERRIDKFVERNKFIYIFQIRNSQRCQNNTYIPNNVFHSPEGCVRGGYICKDPLHPRRQGCVFMKLHKFKFGL